MVVCREQTIQMKHLYFSHNGEGEKKDKPAVPLPSGMKLKELEKRFIMQTLNEQNGNRTWTANKLGISVRTLRNKLREYSKETN